MSESALMDATQAARELRGQITGVPLDAVSVVAWLQDGKQILMVRVDPRYAAAVRVPAYFRGFRVEIRRKAPFKAY
jgi:hypothetical protein